MLPHDTLIQWSAPEYHYQKKNPDWFWAVGIIATTISIISLLYNNVLFALFVLLSAFTLMMYAAKQPKIVSFSLNEHSIHIDDAEHSFLSLKSFWIHRYETGDILIIESGKILAPYMRIPIDRDIPTEHIREILLESLPEKEHRESLSETIMEFLGF